MCTPGTASSCSHIFHSSRGRRRHNATQKSRAIKPNKNLSTFTPFNGTGPGGQRPAGPEHAFAEVLASDGPLARAVGESTEEVGEAVAKVPILFRSATTCGA